MSKFSLRSVFPSVPGRYFPLQLALLVGTLSCFMTYWLWSNAQLTASKALQSEFDFRVRETTAQIMQRMDTYRQALRATKGLMHGSIDIERERFRSYIATLRVGEQYPGVQGIAISKIVPTETLEQHVDFVRRQGFPDYAVRPPGQRDLYTAITHIEPFDKMNRRAFGFDMFSEPVRRAAMEQSRDTGQAALSGKVILVQEGEADRQPGFLMYLPVYALDKPIDTVEKKRTAILGWVYAPFRAHDFMAALGGERSQDLKVRIFDGKEASQQACLFGCADIERQPPLFNTRVAIDIVGRPWTIDIASTPAFESRMNNTRPQVILLAGLGLSALLTVLIWILASGRNRAIANQRQQAFLLELTDRIGKAIDPGQVMEIASKMTGEYLKAGRVGYAEIDEVRGLAIGNRDWTNGTFAGLAGEARPLSGFGDAIVAAFKCGETLSVADVATDPRTAPFLQGYDSIGTRAAIVVPLLEGGRWKASLHVHEKTPRPWTDTEVGVVEEVARRTAEAVRRARTEEELRQSEMRLQKVIDANPIGVVHGDRDGRIIGANTSFLRMIGKSPMDVASGAVRWDVFTPPEYIDEDRAAIAEMNQKGVASIYEKEFVLENGQRVPVLVAGAAFGQSGELIAFVVDISDRKRAEQALLEETRILELLSQSGQSLAATLDLNTLLQTVTDSGRALTGAEFGAFFYNGKNASGDAYLLYTLSGAPREAFDGFGHPRATAVFKPTFTGAPAIRSDDITKDPRYGKMAPHHGMPEGHLPVRSYLAAPVISRSGEVIGGLFFGHSQVAAFNERAERLITGLAAQAAMAIDNARLYALAQKAAEERQSLLTSERAARAEAERLNRSKDEFLAMLAHELRNPLAPVSAAAGILRVAGHDPHRVRQVSDIISRQIGHFTHLIDDLMDVSRVTRGLIRLDAKPIDLTTVVTAAIEQVKPMIDAKNHRLTTQINADRAIVHGDWTRLVQVIANLLSNAAKYTPAHGEISLKLEANDEEVHVVISDNGSGIDPALLPHVFDLFTQGSRGLDRSQGGLGIGLALVKTIVGLHQGDVKAFSEGPGKGSAFTVRIPLMQSAGAAPDEPKNDFTAAASQSVLLVDDNLDAANSLAMLLRAVGHRVSLAADAQQAIDQADHERFDVFILDIGLPDMSGYELARALRRRGLEDSTYIALTGYGQPHDRQLSSEAGFAHHFVKPVNNQVLLEVLAEAGSASRRA